MNKKILLKTLLPIATVALLGGGIAPSLVLTSCSKNDPSHYVGNMEGTDWKGYESGEIQYILEDDGSYTLYLWSTIIEYSAKDWVIPYKVKDSEGTVFNVKKIIGALLDRSQIVLTGTLTIPDSVTNIDSNAFNGCSGLTGSLTIPNSVTRIGANAFAGCSGFTGNLTIGNHVTSIGNNAFYGCSGLTGSLTIPDSVTTIGGGAFASCSGLTGSLTIPDRVESIGGDAFENCSGLTGSLTIPNSVRSIGWTAFHGCSGFTNITLTNFEETPGWTGDNIFQDFSDNGTVSVSGDDSITAGEALTYLVGKGLPSTWFPA